jgi:hypothetical protein
MINCNFRQFFRNLENLLRFWDHLSPNVTFSHWLCVCGIWKWASVYVRKNVCLSVLSAFGLGNSPSHQNFNGIHVGLDESETGLTRHRRVGRGWVKFHPDYNILQFSLLFQNSWEFSQTLHYLLSAYISLCYFWIKSYWPIENFYVRDAMWSYYGSITIYLLSEKSEEATVLLIRRERTNIKNWDFHDCTEEIPRYGNNPSLIGLCVDRSNSSTV